MVHEKTTLKKNTMSQPTLNSGEKSVQRCRTNKFLTIKVFKLKFNSHLLPSWFITHLVKKSEEEKNKPQLSERSGNSLKLKSFYICSIVQWYTREELESN